MSNDTTENKYKRVKFPFESIARSIPLIIGFLILCGSLYLDTFYGCFNINIFNYLDTTEILTTFLYIIKEILFILAFIAVYMLSMKCLYWVVDKLFYSKTKNTSSEQTETKAENNVFTQSDKIPFGVIIFSIVFCIISIVKSYTIEINSNNHINTGWMREVLLGYVIVGSIFIIAQYEAGKKNGLRNMIIFFTLFFISFSINKAFEHIEQTITGADFHSTVILEKDTIKTTPKYIYVGRTNKYVFFFNLDKKVTDVIPQEGIKKISFSHQKP